MAKYMTKMKLNKNRQMNPLKELVKQQKKEQPLEIPTIKSFCC